MICHHWDTKVRTKTTRKDLTASQILLSCKHWPCRPECFYTEKLCLAYLYLYILFKYIKASSKASLWATATDQSKHIKMKLQWVLGLACVTVLLFCVDPCAFNTCKNALWQCEQGSEQSHVTQGLTSHFHFNFFWTGHTHINLPFWGNAALVCSLWLNEALGWHKTQ